MNLAESIKNYISSRRNSPVKAEELFEYFQGDADFSEFASVLDELISAGELVYVKKGRITIPETAGYMRGTFRSNAKGFGFFVPDPEFRKRTGGDLFISSSDTMGAVSGDIVSAVMTAHPYGDSKNGEGRIVRIIEHTLKTVVGTLKVIESLRKRGTPRYYVKPDDRHLGFNITVEGEVSASVGEKVEIEITEYPSVLSAAKGKILQVFGSSDSTEANYSAILSENGIKTEFDHQTLLQAEEVSAMVVSPENRADLREEIIFTIDGADAKDLDDAISVKRKDSGYILGVHIADVSHYVTPNTYLDSEAFERGTSVYFADQVIPMLPSALSNGCCSLNSGTDKYALSAFVELDEKGEIESCELVESIINTKIRGVYSEVNDLIAKGERSEFAVKYEAVKDVLPLITELYGILEKKSRKRGALDLETVEAKVIVENGIPIDIVRRERGIAECIIEQFMLCANEAVANWLFWQNVPCVYRIHESPSPEKIQNFSRFAHNLGLNITPLRSKNIHSTALESILEEARDTDVATTVSYMLLRSLMKARYSSEASPHFGLAIEKYCHFTSPIRRYPDLSVHRIIKALLHGEMDEETVSYYSAFAAASAEKSSENEQKAVNAERDIDDLYKTIYMSERIGEIYDGVISSVTSFGMFVELENTCEGLVPVSSLRGYFDYDERNMTLSCGKTVYEIGMKVKVKITAADIISRKTEMSIV